jgi:MFS family permease
MFPFVFGPDTPGGGFLTTAQVAVLSTVAYAANIGANLFFGVFGDHFGWRRTVTVFGCLGCAVATPLWYFGAIASQSFLLTAVLGAVYGIVLAGFVPLSALMLVIRSDVDGVPPRRRRSERPDGVTGGSTTGRRSQLSPPRRSRSGGAAW